MKDSLKRWLEEDGEEFLRGVGIRRGQFVLDFGCGSGNYVIPTARIVGRGGRVYALDKDRWHLNELVRRVKSLGLENTVAIETSGEVKIELKEKSVDAVLLYDVLHYYYFPRAADRRRLLGEVHRILKPKGLLSLYPSHLQSYMRPQLDEVTKEISEAGFYLANKYSGMLFIHGNMLEKRQVLNFRKK